MIQCKNLTFGYKKQPVYDNFNWNLTSGSICGLLGPNGAGKTTLFKILTGLMFQRGGEVSVLGHNPNKREENFYKKLTYVAEELPCPNMSPREYASICGPLYPNFSIERFEELCQSFEVNENKDFSNYSAGDLRKAWLSITLSCRTELILLDEPSKGLDINAQTVLRKVLAETAADGSTIILSTHHVREVEGLLDYITIIDRGGHLRLNAGIENLYKEYSLIHSLTKEQIPTESLAYQRRATGWTALLKEPSNSPQDIPLELLFTGLCGKKKEVSNE
ncbi:ABC-2 type transport system ATP-binding protein [Natranaerovirga pectinivora]|uniref:ABC-2 type transport system ATP-binding protein n=1 Tax=Natranaerovirga pectinivora TaxID=682400 RepID=A0A4R3MEJ9_9FIRM|nr:ATP-binding cassette domain-containing protein [Natranaerovirga pectinivora]TCT12218.1 ABC-2 type transport system ATP-binding protein [Natranaerovirga pectinivora]